MKLPIQLDVEDAVFARKLLKRGDVVQITSPIEQ
jgi:hypothetical protein